jgi:hypothetical protein
VGERSRKAVPAETGRLEVDGGECVDEFLERDAVL